MMVYLLFILSYFFVVLTFIPIIKSNFWMVRVLDYPRYQKLVVLLILSILVLWWIPFSIHTMMVLLLMAISIFYLVWHIFPYTRVANVQLCKSRQANSNTIKIMIANVRQKNRQSDKCLDLIQRVDPDVVLLVETNKWWHDQIRDIINKYPFEVTIPQENTYGMLLYSRFRLHHTAVRFLFDDEIPSIRTTVRLPDGEDIVLYCLHPTPPVPSQSLDSEDRDAEILQVGKEAKEISRPTIVAGDLNDVAWSHTTKLFLKVSGLLDPRRGRGFYNTFHADYPLLRWPLDHIFCSKHFELSHLKRLPSIGSDHFPMFIELALSEQLVNEHEDSQLKSDSGDLKEAREKIEEAS